MGSVACELLLLAESLLEAIEHGVEGLRHAVYLIVAIAQTYALGQVVRSDDLASRLDCPVRRAEGAAHDEIAAKGREEEDQGKED